MPKLRPRIAAVVLAAGESRRMGLHKPLLPIGERTILQHVLSNLADSKSVDPIVVVTGHQADALRPTIEAFGAAAIYNPDYATGEMLSSIRAGLRSARENADAAMIVLGDQPLLQVSTIAALASAWRSRRSMILLARHAAKRGHPIIVASGAFDEIISLPPGATLKTFTACHGTETVELNVDDPGILKDIDTPADYAQAVQEHERSSKKGASVCPD